MKRLISLFLCLVLAVGIIPANATDGDIAVYVSFSVYGELAPDKNGEVIANREITLNGEVTVNDALYKLHALYCEEGESAYETGTSDWGAYITKLWGDSSGNFGYQVNGGSVYTTLDTVLNDGDRLDACIYKNLYPDTENYTTFDVSAAEVFEGESVTLTLTVAGYDEEYNMVFSPLEGATITIDGKMSDIVTDENGEAEIALDKAGDYIISAKMDKTLIKKDENGEITGEETVPAITAPACTLTVKMTPENELIHGIAGAYIEDGILDSGSNLPWIASDLAVYESIYGEVIDDTLRQKILDKLILDAENMNSPGDLSKTIIALSALGYDASVVYTSSGAQLKLVEKLLSLVDAKDENVTNMYTLPYVIIALNEGDFATSEQIEYLVKFAVNSKEDWLKTEDMGTDAMTPMLLALSPYYDDEAVSAALDAAVEILKAEQREDGLIDGFPGYEGASTGLAICGLSALGIDASEVSNGGKNLIEGLLSDANEEKDALSNAFATEQGFRGLLAWKMLGKRMYDFCDFPKNEARATRVSTGGGGGGSSKPKEEPKEEPEETPEEETMPEITFPDVNEGDWYYDAVAFVCEKGLFNGTDKGFEPSGKMTRAMLVTVLYRLSGEEASSVSAFSDVKAGDWYCDAVGWAYDAGIVNGVNATTFAPNDSITREQMAAILYRFAKMQSEDVTGVDISEFSDADDVSDYAVDAFSYAVKNGIITGKGENTLAPGDSATRAEVATILMRYVSK